jgi:DNA-binding MarR family transcriptional regulator
MKFTFAAFLYSCYTLLMREQADDPDSARAWALAAQIRVLTGKLKRRLREQAHLGDLTWSQAAALSRLERDGPATVSTLARAEGVRPQSMGATVSALEAAGLLAGAPDPADGRQTILSLTAACRERIEAGRAAREDWLFRAIQTKLAPDEQEQLASAVELLERLVET